MTSFDTWTDGDLEAEYLRFGRQIRPLHDRLGEIDRLLWPLQLRQTEVFMEQCRRHPIDLWPVGGDVLHIRRDGSDVTLCAETLDPAVPSAQRAIDSTCCWCRHIFDLWCRSGSPAF